MSEVKGQGYVKEIIEEYNIRLKSWGHSDTWNLNQFKTLENMLLEVTRINVNANTLKRFFQQRTSNPQLATKEALCIFLGYKGYTDFVMKKTKQEAVDLIPEENDEEQDTENLEKEQTASGKNRIGQYSKGISNHIKRRNKRYFYMVLFFMIIIAGYFLYKYKLKDIYIDYLISKIEFSVSRVRGTSPLTVTFSYDIPSPVFDEITIVYKEANGDILERKLLKGSHSVNTTYIYEGESFCYLKYKDKEIRKILLQSRKSGWSVSVREERKNIYKTFPISQALNDDGYVSLPFDSIPLDAQSNHIFVSYIFYKENLVNGDNFIFEAKVRNSAKEYAIPCGDIMMYISSDTGVHGFAMNENCYAYIKFVSGENEIKGDQYSLQQFDFNPSQWHVMKIKVIDKKTTFYVDGKAVLNMGYNNLLGFANELILRFKGCGAVDWVKISKPDGELVYEENFNEELH